MFMLHVGNVSRKAERMCTELQTHDDVTMSGHRDRELIEQLGGD